MTHSSTMRAILYARPLAGETDRPTSLDPSALNVPFETTFEEALAAIASEPRGFVEPDGSFTLGVDGSTRRIEGEVYDFATEQGEARVHHVDVRGPADATLWRRVLAALSPQGVERILVFMPERGTTLPGDEFLSRLLSKD